MPRILFIARTASVIPGVQTGLGCPVALFDRTANDPAFVLVDTDTMTIASSASIPTRRVGFFRRLAARLCPTKE